MPHPGGSKRPTRVGADACPGVLRPWSADDGAIVRLRFPRGLTPARLRAVMAAAQEFGAPFLQLTSRANLQVRGLPDPLPAEVVERFESLVESPSPTHERVRNILVEPFDPQAADAAARLDDALCARADLAGLPGRFLFAVMGTRSPGRVLGENPDITVVAADEADKADAVVVRAPDGLLRHEVPRGQGIGAALDVAAEFLTVRPDDRVWRLGDLPANAPVFASFSAMPVHHVSPLLPGPLAGGLFAAIPLGLMDAEGVRALCEAAENLGSERLWLTPWRGICLPTATPTDAVWATLAERGFGDPDARRVTACIGSPWCRRTDVETVPLARSLLGGAGVPGGPPVHLSGCPRRCGAPQRPHVDLFPTPTTTSADLLRQWSAETETA